MKKHCHIILSAIFLITIFQGCTSPIDPSTKKEPVVKNPKEILEEFTTFVTNVTDYKVTELHKSVTAHEICFETNRTLPLRMCILDIDLTDKSLSLEATYPSDFTETTWPVRTMLKQAEIVEEQGRNVLAAFNADFFDIGATGFPDGAVYHNGEGVKTTDLKGIDVMVFFGISKAGRAIMGTYTDYVVLDKSDIRELVCGKTHLVKYGKPLENGDPSLAPRTAVATNKDGNRVQVVIVDELTPNTPRNGINYYDLACCMNKLGAYHAVNFDGGGSSTFLIKEDDSFRAWNKQPGATLRAVADGMALIVND